MVIARVQICPNSKGCYRFCRSEFDDSRIAQPHQKPQCVAVLDLFELPILAGWGHGCEVLSSGARTAGNYLVAAGAFCLGERTVGEVRAY